MERDDLLILATGFVLVWLVAFLSGLATGFGLVLPATVASIAATVTMGGAAALVWAIDRGSE